MTKRKIENIRESIMPRWVTLRWAWKKIKEKKNTRRGCAIITTSVFRPQHVREYTYGRMWLYALFVYELHTPPPAVAFPSVWTDRRLERVNQFAGDQARAYVNRDRFFFLRHYVQATNTNRFWDVEQNKVRWLGNDGRTSR